jgi:hypothetical protein
MVTFILIEAVALVVSVACIFGVVKLYPEWRGRRRLRRGKCPGCGYSMAGGGVYCPECGVQWRPG